jgi:uncharacterized membrane protein required for colicin V production
MVSLTFLFWTFVILFGVIGAMRGWAKELIVSFSVLVALFVITVLERYVPFVRDTIVLNGGANQFWMRLAILIGLVFFGYQTPNITRLATSGKFTRDRLQDSLLGLFLGAINGYLVFGTIWFYLHEAQYPFPLISPPLEGTQSGEAALTILKYLAPRWLGIPVVYFAVAICFVFVLVVFI